MKHEHFPDCTAAVCSPTAADSLQQLSIQTMNADPFLKRPLSDMSRTCSPPPTSLSLVTRGTYSSVVNANR